MVTQTAIRPNRDIPAIKTIFQSNIHPCIFHLTWLLGYRFLAGIGFVLLVREHQGTNDQNRRC
jgi:hypothetical protein